MPHDRQPQPLADQLVNQRLNHGGAVYVVAKGRSSRVLQLSALPTTQEMHLNTTCPVPAGAENYGVRGTAWKPILWSALACTLATIGITLSLITLHLRRYRVPKEQRQIIRLAFCVVIYAVVAFFEVYSYEVAQYIDPIGDLYEAFGLWYVQ